MQPCSKRMSRCCTYPVEERDAVEEVRVCEGQGAGRLAEPGPLHLQKPQGKQRKRQMSPISDYVNAGVCHLFAGDWGLQYMDCRLQYTDCTYILPWIIVDPAWFLSAGYIKTATTLSSRG